MNIAILMSTYNGSKYLDEQLESLSKQTMVSYMTVYIRDDGSSDNTIEIINSYKNRLSIELLEEENVGPARSFWILLNKVTGADYYLFCDQDDVWDYNKVEKSISLLNGHTVLAACNCRLIDGEGKVISPIRLSEQPYISIPSLFVSGFTQGCSIAFTGQLRKKIVNSNIHCVPMHDIITILYGMNLGEIKWIDTPLFSYRIHGSNVVAKNKSVIDNIKRTFWNWKNTRKNSMANVALELLKNEVELSGEDIVFLTCMANYRGSMKNKIRIITNKKTLISNRKALRSFRIRTILNLI